MPPSGGREEVVCTRSGARDDADPHHYSVCVVRDCLRCGKKGRRRTLKIPTIESLLVRTRPRVYAVPHQTCLRILESVRPFTLHARQICTQYLAQGKGTGVLVNHAGYSCIVAGTHILQTPVAASKALAHFILPEMPHVVTVSRVTPRQG